MQFLESILFLAVIKISVGLLKVDPVWITSPYLKAGSNDVIKTLTGNSSTPTATMPFSTPAFSSLPNLGYGCTAYQGKIHEM